MNAGEQVPAKVDLELADVLFELEGAENYKQWILSVIRPYVSGNVLEVGAGRGTFSCELRDFGDSLTAVEPSTRLVEYLVSRLNGVAGSEVLTGVVSDVTGHDFHAAVMLNVLEHIHDDAAVLREIFDRLAPGGTLCVWVPAFPALLGDFDRSVGHHRRYTKSVLIGRLRAAGFAIETAHYANLPGFFAWLLMIRMLRMRPTTGGMSMVYDRWIVPAVRAVEERWKPPFGQSLFAVGRRPS